MKLRLEWDRPIQLRDGRKENLIYTLDVARLPRSAGIYVLARRWGGRLEALYVGKAVNLRNRLHGQLNNLKLMKHLRGAKGGKRIVLLGRFISKRGQQLDKCLTLIERVLIRHYLSEGHDLVNIHGATLRQHEIRSDGHHPRRFLPSLMFVERGKGE